MRPNVRFKINFYVLSIFIIDIYVVSLHKKMKFPIKGFFSKCDQIRRQIY